jgi:sarcosine oxidase subunit beta
LSLKQLRTGAFLIGGGWATEVNEEKHATRTLRENIEENWNTAVAVVPSVANAMPATAWGGLEGDSFDGVPLIGPAHGVEGLYLALGFSGHGFQISPAVGAAVAEAVQNGTTPEALRELSPSRSFSGT